MIEKEILKEKEIKEKLSEDWILARIILEMIGKPKEYLLEQLENHILKSEKIDGIKIAKYEIEDPEEKDNVFSTFAEVELLFKTPLHIIYFSFEFLPAHFEIVEPNEFLFTAKDLTDIINDLLIKLHNWDKTVRVVNEQNKILYKNHSTLIRNLIFASLLSGPKEVNELERMIGMPIKSFWNIIEELKQQGKIREKGSKFELVRK